LVLAAAAPTTTYPDDPRLEAPPKPKKGQERPRSKRWRAPPDAYDWAALGFVTVVSIVTSVIFTIFAGERHPLGLSGTLVLSLGYVLLGLAGLLVLFGIYLIVPQFH
jgi:hypothetical protein